MPLTVRHFARAALLVVGCAAAVLLGLVAVSRSDAALAHRLHSESTRGMRTPAEAP